MLDQLTCPNCGATLLPPAPNSDVVTCQYCHTTFRIPSTSTPQLDMGNLILGADFRRQPIVGWGFPNPDNIHLSVDGTLPELRAKFPAASSLYYVLNSSGYFDNLDVSVSIKFYEGDLDCIDAGMVLRYQKSVGSYSFLISPLGTYSVAYYEKGDANGLKWNAIMNWSNNNALLKGLNQVNRLRVIANGPHLKVYINGVIATSIHDSRYEEGEVLLAAEGTVKSGVDVGFSNLQLREVTANSN